jgi:flavin-dependent dehydrogenase
MDPDVLVIGAGPAGCAAARLLAAWGHRVLVVDRPGAGTGRLAESIPPSTQSVLAALGALPAIEDAGFMPWRGNLVWWGEGEPRVEMFSPGVAGYQVERLALARQLRGLAIASGAELREGVVREVELGTSPKAIVDDTTPGLESGPASVSASVVLDCSGRPGVVARRGFRRADASFRTVALAGLWRADRWPVGDDTQTLVASYPDGWAWSISTERGVRYVTVMVDPARTGLRRGGSSRDVYRAELAKVRAFGPLLKDATLVDGLWGADASPYDAREYAGGGFLLVGDAGSFIDPLSSYGVKKALASGWLAAIVTHTALTRPEMRDEALAFFTRREREIYASAGRRSARFAAEATGDEPDHPFWLARASRPDECDFDHGADVASLAHDADVLAAFDDLRQRPFIRLRQGAGVRVEPRAAVRGREIALEDHLLLPAWPNGIRYLRNVDLVALLRAAPAHRDVGDLCEAMSRLQPAIPLPDMLGALSVLIAQRALRHAESRG